MDRIHAYSCHATDTTSYDALFPPYIGYVHKPSGSSEKLRDERL